ncbi:MAG: YicC family protein [Gammaproteobacteria bacterium]|nr:YicC family protein [Gammaproteobacteria bacterium]
MARSMTAFARVQRNTEWGAMSIELRSVNHRFLEPSLRLPEDLRSLEPAIRDRLGKRLNRGKVDVGIRFQVGGEAAQSFTIDEPLMKRVLEAAALVQEKADDIAPLAVNDVLRWPGLVMPPDIDEAGLAAAALALVDEALGQLLAGREREGETLKQLMVQRLDTMTALVTGLRDILPELRQAYRQRVLDRLADARQEMDQDRLEQEMVLHAQKSDVDEELDRLDTHIKEVRRVLDQKEPIGRRLDFLMQELNREANTLGSKANDVRQTNVAVELKVLIEQMREQVQNIE